MNGLNEFKKMAIGTPLGVLVITALPVFGTAGASTVASMLAGALIGGLIDEINDASH